MPATFFIPGWVVDHHTDRCKEIRDAGYEIGHHGYSHEWADPEHQEKEAEELDRVVTPIAVFTKREGRLALASWHPDASLDEIRDRTGFVFEADGAGPTRLPTEDEVSDRL